MEELIKYLEEQQKYLKWKLEEVQEYYSIYDHEDARIIGSIEGQLKQIEETLAKISCKEK